MSGIITTACFRTARSSTRGEYHTVDDFILSHPSLFCKLGCTVGTACVMRKSARWFVPGSHASKQADCRSGFIYPRTINHCNINVPLLDYIKNSYLIRWMICKKMRLYRIRFTLDTHSFSWNPLLSKSLYSTWGAISLQYACLVWSTVQNLIFNLQSHDFSSCNMHETV